VRASTTPALCLWSDRKREEKLLLPELLKRPSRRLGSRHVAAFGRLPKMLHGAWLVSLRGQNPGQAQMRPAEVGPQLERLLIRARCLRQLLFSHQKRAPQFVRVRQIRVGTQCGFDGFLRFVKSIQLGQRQRVVV